MKIATWNINSIKSRLGHVLDWSVKNQPDVLCLQETKVSDDIFPLVKLKEAGFEYTIFHGERTYNGVAILSRHPLTEIQKNFPGDDAGVQSRLIAATVKGIRILNAYVPHGTRIGTPKFEYKLEWLAFLRRYLDEFYDPEDDVLLCGDFNITPHEMDLWDTALWRNKLHYTKPERDALIEVKRWGFVDLFRQLNPDAREYSWWGMFHPHMFPHNKGLRLDHIWATEPLAEICTDCWIDKEPRGWDKPSDHAPVIAEFST